MVKCWDDIKNNYLLVEGTIWTHKNEFNRQWLESPKSIMGTVGCPGVEKATVPSSTSFYHSGWVGHVAALSVTTHSMELSCPHSVSSSWRSSNWEWAPRPGPQVFRCSGEWASGGPDVPGFPLRVTIPCLLLFPCMCSTCTSIPVIKADEGVWRVS